MALRKTPKMPSPPSRARNRRERKAKRNLAKASRAMRTLLTCSSRVSEMTRKPAARITFCSRRMVAPRREASKTESVAAVQAEDEAVIEVEEAAAVVVATSKDKDADQYPHYFIFHSRLIKNMFPMKRGFGVLGFWGFGFRV